MNETKIRLRKSLAQDCMNFLMLNQTNLNLIYALYGIRFLASLPSELLKQLRVLAVENDYEYFRLQVYKLLARHESLENQQAMFAGLLDPEPEVRQYCLSHLLDASGDGLPVLLLQIFEQADSALKVEAIKWIKSRYPVSTIDQLQAALSEFGLPEELNLVFERLLHLYEMPSALRILRIQSLSKEHYDWAFGQLFKYPNQILRARLELEDLPHVLKQFLLIGVRQAEISDFMSYTPLTEDQRPEGIFEALKIEFQQRLTVLLDLQADLDSMINKFIPERRGDSGSDSYFHSSL